MSNVKASNSHWFGVATLFACCTACELVLAQSLVPQGYFVWAVFCLVFAACTYTDLRWKKIRNYWTYSATVWLLFTSLILQLANGETTTFFLHPLPSFAMSLAGSVSCFGVLLLIYSISGGGAGDVKIAAVVGAGLGLQSGLMALVYTYIAAATWILIRSIWGVGPLEILKLSFRIIGNFFLPGRFGETTTGEQKFMSQQLPMAPFFSIGVLFALWEMVYLK